jgi:uncharacterized membrane protein YdjX (TVP38/TMEM64 family)
VRPLRLALTVTLAVLVIAIAGRRIAPRILPLVAAVHALGPAGPVLFILLSAVAIVAMIPASWLTIAGGAVFGILPGAIYAFVGAMIGSTAAFVLGRYAARAMIERRLERMPRLAAIDRAVSARGRRIVFLLRLSPITPFNFLNYALALTNLSVRDFVVASLGMVPAAFAYAYAGSVAGEALALAGQAAGPRGASYYAVLTAGLAATVVAVAVVARTARRALGDV